MKNIDKMLHDARRRAGQNLSLFLAFITPRKGKYVSSCCLWGGVPGSGQKTIEKDADSIDEAAKQVGQLAGQYPGFHGVPIIIDDIPRRCEDG